MHPDDQAIADGYFALCSDGNHFDSDDFAKTCSGGAGVTMTLAGASAMKLYSARAGTDEIQITAIAKDLLRR